MEDQIYANLGEPLPLASDEQLVQFEQGLIVAQKQVVQGQGAGPHFTVTFCGACHEKPTIGGGAGRYRNFLIVAHKGEDGSFEFLGEGGVQRHYSIYEEGRVPTEEEANIIATRNPIPFYGAGLISQIEEEAILENVDEEDEDGNGISGRVNLIRAPAPGPREAIGRFGRKAQTHSIESFIRGPLRNHLGVTTSPLTISQRKHLPFVPQETTTETLVAWFGKIFSFPLALAQGPFFGRVVPDEDDIPDPEMTNNDLLNLVTMSHLLAVPKPDPLTETTSDGAFWFSEIGCTSCHIQSLRSPLGPIPLYSDLLLHDMGPDLQDGLEFGLATSSEFRTQPLWGIGVVGPYLHDGRADTLDEAIRFHGGEALTAKNNYENLTETQRHNLVLFLESLGGASQKTEGLLPPNQEIPEENEWGSPDRELTSAEQTLFRKGRDLFDRDFLFQEGLGEKFNGDSCRACHFLPVLGGAGPADVNVFRQGMIDEEGDFTPPTNGTILHKFLAALDQRPEPDPLSNHFEHRQTPPLFGLGLIEQIPRNDILALADPNDENSDGISGKAHILEDDRLGRFGWKADIPSTEEFIRDAFSNEMGLTLPLSSAHTFGETSDGDNAVDPEISSDEFEQVSFFLKHLSPPPQDRSSLQSHRGAEVFSETGCQKCHTPFFDLPSGKRIFPYSDFLLHDVAAESFKGIESGEATQKEFRTPPLWGISHTAPFMHDGMSTSLEEAILRHEGEARTAKETFEGLSATDKTQLMEFLSSL